MERKKTVPRNENENENVSTGGRCFNVCRVTPTRAAVALAARQSFNFKLDGEIGTGSVGSLPSTDAIRTDAAGKRSGKTIFTYITSGGVKD